MALLALLGTSARSSLTGQIFKNHLHGSCRSCQTQSIDTIFLVWGPDIEWHQPQISFNYVQKPEMFRGLAPLIASEFLSTTWFLGHVDLALQACYARKLQLYVLDWLRNRSTLAWKLAFSFYGRFCERGSPATLRPVLQCLARRGFDRPFRDLRDLVFQNRYGKPSELLSGCSTAVP